MGPGSSPRQPVRCPTQREIGVTVYNYETAVHVEDVEALTAELVALIAKATEHIPEDHIRNAITAASLLTAAQRRGGITGMVRHMAGKWL
jgi:hypothetical protein